MPSPKKTTALRRARAMTVKVEFTAPEVTKTLASVTKDVVAPSTEDALT